MKTLGRILVAEGEVATCDSLAAWLREDGHTVDTAPSGRVAVEMAGRQDYALYFVDLKMPGGMDGIETMIEILRLHPDAAIILITAYATIDAAIHAMKEGAQEYIVKPCNRQEISLRVNRIIHVKDLQRENAVLRKEVTRRYRFQDVIGKSSRMRAILELAAGAANLPSPILIRGENGAGKRILARAIHDSSGRAAGPFLAVSCAAAAGTLLDTELFGCEKGTFTGADQPKRGKFELAGGGSIFLGEIGEMSGKLQADLIRVLEQWTFSRPGGTEEVRIAARLIAGTQIDLLQAVADGRFRKDLYDYLSAIEIRIPPLRERREDIPLLAQHFVERFAYERGKDVKEISGAALKILLDYDWPGNVGELKNAVERAVVTCRGETLTEENFAFLMESGARARGWAISAGMSLEEMEKRLIVATIRGTGGNIKEAAARLGIDRSTLYEKIKRYAIPR